MTLLSHATQWLCILIASCALCVAALHVLMGLWVFVLGALAVSGAFGFAARQAGRWRV